MSSATSGSVSWEVRQAEIELRMYESCPAARPWLLDAAFQENTSGVIASRYNRANKSAGRARRGRVDHDFFFHALDGGPERPQQRPPRHVRVDLLRHPDA